MRVKRIENSAIDNNDHAIQTHYAGPFLLFKEGNEEVLYWLRFIVNQEDAVVGSEVCEKYFPKDLSHSIFAPSLKETDWQPYHYADPSFPKVSIFDPQTNEVYCLVVIDQKLYRNPFRKIPQRDADNTLIGLNIVPLPFSMAQVYSYQNSHFCSVAKPPVLSHKIEASDYPKWPGSLLKRIQFVSVEMFESNKNDVEALNQIIERCGKNIKTDMNPFQVSQVLNAIQWAIISLWSATSKSKKEYHSALMHVLHGTVDSEASQNELTDSALSNARYLRSKLIPSQINQLGAGDNFYYLAEGASKNITINEVRRYYISLIKKQLPQKLRHQIQITFPENFEVLVGSTIPSTDFSLWNLQTLSREGEQILQILYRWIVDDVFPEELSLETLKSIDALLTAMISAEYGTHTEFQIIAHTLQVACPSLSPPLILLGRNSVVQSILHILSNNNDTPFIEYLPYLRQQVQFYGSEPLNQDSQELFEWILQIILNHNYPSELERLDKIKLLLERCYENFRRLLTTDALISMSGDTQSDLVIHYVASFFNWQPRGLNYEILAYAAQACDIFILSLQGKLISGQPIPKNHDLVEDLPRIAAEKGDINLLRELLKNKIEMNIARLLNLAICKDQIQVIELLLPHAKTAINAIVTYDYTLLYSALCCRNPIIVDKLLTAGANTLEYKGKSSNIAVERCEKLIFKKENGIQLWKSVSQILNEYVAYITNSVPRSEFFDKKNVGVIDKINHVINKIKKMSDDTPDDVASLKIVLAQLCIDHFQVVRTGAALLCEWVAYCFTVINEYCQEKSEVKNTLTPTLTTANNSHK